MQTSKERVGSLRLGFVILFALVSSIVLLAASCRQDSLGWLLDDALPDWRMIALYPLLALAWSGKITLELLRRRSRRPLPVVRAMLRRNRFNVATMPVLFVLVIVNTQAFSALKQMIPSFIPFYLDPPLIDLDHAIFGTDPWRLTHGLVGPFGTMLLDKLYVAFFPITTGVIYWIILTNDRRFQLRALLTSVLISFLVGFVIATLLSSSGPVFYHLHYGESRFDALTDRLAMIDQRYPLEAVAIAKWLKTSPPTLGGGISAMPSVHVGIAWFTYLLFRHRFGKNSWVTWAGLIYFALVWFASVHLAWHYFTDGLLSLVVVSGIWWLAGLFVEKVERQDESSTVEKPSQASLTQTGFRPGL